MNAGGRRRASTTEKEPEKAKKTNDSAVERERVSVRPSPLLVGREAFSYAVL